MIALMRKALKGDAYRYILWAFMFAMAFGSGALFFFKDDSQKNWVLRVYDESVTDSMWQATITNIERQRDMFKQYGITYEHPLTPAQEAYRAQLSTLLVEHIANKLHIAMPDALLQKELEAQLKNLPAHFFRKDGSLDVQRFEQQIAPQKLTDFMDSIASQAQAGMVQEFLALGNYVTHDELVLQYNEEYANKNYTIVALSDMKFAALAQKKSATDEQLQSLYKELKNDAAYKTAEQRAATYWTFKESDYGIAVTEKDVKAQYEKVKQEKYATAPAKVQVRHIVISKESEKARERAEELLAQVTKNPESFESVAKKHSHDKKTAEKGGLLPTFARDSKEYDALVVKTAFEQLQKDGQISGVIKTKEGYQILQRVQRHNAQYQSFDAVKHALEKDLRAEKFKKRFMADAQRVASTANYQPEGVANFVAKKGGKEHTMQLHARGKDAIDSHLFTTGSGRCVAFMDGETAILLRCTQVEKSVSKPFAQVKSEVQDAWFAKQGQALMKRTVQEILARGSKADLDTYAKEYNGVMQHAQYTYKTDGSIDQSELLKRSTVSSKLGSLQLAGSMIAVEDKGETLIIRLDSMDALNQELFDAKEASMRAILSNAAKFKAQESFVASLYRHATINKEIHVKKEIESHIKSKATV